MSFVSKLNLSLAISVTFLSACSSIPDDNTAIANPKETNRPDKIEFFSKNFHQNFEQEVKTRLDRFYSDWKGTPYRLGGISKRGIDCSGFVQVMMSQVFNMNLPRTTTMQAQTGSQIDRSQAKFGDLVFFKTGRSQRHVGLYLGDGKFMHASTSRGVMISSISNVYWSKRVWQYRTYS